MRDEFETLMIEGGPRDRTYRADKSECFVSDNLCKPQINNLAVAFRVNKNIF
jgi:hypothetical protein